MSRAATLLPELARMVDSVRLELLFGTKSPNSMAPLDDADFRSDIAAQQFLAALTQLETAHRFLKIAELLERDANVSKR